MLRLAARLEPLLVEAPEPPPELIIPAEVLAAAALEGRARPSAASSARADLLDMRATAAAAGADAPRSSGADDAPTPTAVEEQLSAGAEMAVLSVKLALAQAAVALHEDVEPRQEAGRPAPLDARPLIEAKLEQQTAWFALRRRTFEAGAAVRTLTIFGHEGRREMAIVKMLPRLATSVGPEADEDGEEEEDEDGIDEAEGAQEAEGFEQRVRGATGRAASSLLRVQVRSLDVPKESHVPQHGLALSVILQPVRVLVAIPLLLRTQRWLNTWLGELQQQAAAAAEAAAAAASAAAAEAAEATARAVRAAADEPTPVRLHVRLRGPLLVLPAARGATVVRVGTLELRNSILSGPDAVIEPAGGGHGARWRERTSGAIDRIHLSLTHTGLALVPRAAEAFDGAWMLRAGFAPHWLLDENLQLSLTLDRVLKQDAAAAEREAEQLAQVRLAHCTERATRVCVCVTPTLSLTPTLTLTLTLTV